MEQINQLKALTIAALKMYFRSTSAVFFSLFVPLFIIVIFGLLLNNGGAKSSLGVVDNANNQYSKQFITTLDKTGVFSINKGSEKIELSDLKQGNRDLIVEIPKTFDLTKTLTGDNAISLIYDKAKAQNAETPILIVNNFITRYNEGVYASVHNTTIPTYVSITQKGIETNNLNEIDFLVPGVIAFSIMQSMLFGVAFAFTSMKKTGTLRRLQATPAKPLNFILSQSVARLLLSVAQISLLLFVGSYFFHLHMYGSVILFFVLVILGSIAFLSFGFAVAGYAKDENQAAPLINLISLPMTFLSGVFFPRSIMPDFLKSITGFLPLTYLSDGLREIANNGSGIHAIGGDLLGLLIWAVIGMIIAVRLFKWE